MDKTIEKILHSYKTPMYIFSEACFESNYKELDYAYKRYYSKFSIAYSFKTNYLPTACKMVRSFGGFAEVVSDMEYTFARRYGFPAEKIIVNGPGKWSGLQEMLQNGSIVMLDNVYELKRAISIAESSDREVNIGFRLNFTIGSGKESRFGFDVNNDETAQMISLARESKNIRIVGIHFHLSGARSIEAWKNRAVKMVEYADRFLRPDEKKIIDLGSGMFGHMAPYLAAQFNQETPSFDEYAKEVASVFQNRYGTLAEEMKPMLVVEPGTTIVANTMCYLTTIIATKTIRGRKIAIVDGSVQQLGELGKKKKLPVSIIPSNNPEKNADYAEISGYTCLEDDILFPKTEEKVGVGDVLCFGNAGAYSNVLKPPFIQAGCKIISYSKDGTASLAKRDETADDILASYY